MFCFGTEGDLQTPPRKMEWTLEHHRKFIDTVISLGGLKKPGVKAIARAELLIMVKCFSPAVIVHTFWFDIFQKESESLFCNKRGRSLSSFLDLVRGRPNKLSSPWTLEHHKRVVDATILLGGLNSTYATPKNIHRLLGLMNEEDHPEGFTVRMISHHLSGLRRLQKDTQDIVDFYSSDEDGAQALRDLEDVCRASFKPQTTMQEGLDQQEVSTRLRILSNIQAQLRSLQRETRKRS